MRHGHNRFKIAELESLSDTPRSTVRYYETLGLLPSVDIRGPKLRLYGPEHVATLTQIKRLRAQGLPLREIKPLLKRPLPQKLRGRTNVPSQELRQRILHHATRQFLRLGYERARLDTLVKDIGISKATLYRYFPSKEALFLESVRAIRFTVVSPMQRAKAEHQDSSTHGRTRARAVLENFESYRELSTLLNVLARDPNPTIAKRARAEMHEMITNAEPYLRRQMQEGRFRHFNSELLAYMLWGALLAAGERMSADRSLSTEFVLQTYFDFIQHGMLATVTSTS